jgi:hypothetical protein
MGKNLDSYSSEICYLAFINDVKWGRIAALSCRPLKKQNLKDMYFPLRTIPNV